jgi:hypothetical protein
MKLRLVRGTSVRPPTRQSRIGRESRIYGQRPSDFLAALTFNIVIDMCCGRFASRGGELAVHPAGHTGQPRRDVGARRSPNNTPPNAVHRSTQVARGRWFRKPPPVAHRSIIGARKCSTTPLRGPGSVSEVTDALAHREFSDILSEFCQRKEDKQLTGNGLERQQIGSTVGPFGRRSVLS